MLNSIFKLFSSEKPKMPRPLVMQTVYGRPANPNRLYAAPAAPVIVDKALLTKQMEKLRQQSRYSSIEETTLDKNTLLIGLVSSAPFVFMFSFNLYYRSKEWNSLKKLAAEKKTGIACFETRRNDIACLKLIKKGDSPVCSYLIHSKELVISPTRGWLAAAPAAVSIPSDNHRKMLK